MMSLVFVGDDHNDGDEELSEGAAQLVAATAKWRRSEDSEVRIMKNTKRQSHF